MQVTVVISLINIKERVFNSSFVSLIKINAIFARSAYQFFMSLLSRVTFNSLKTCLYAFIFFGCNLRPVFSPMSWISVCSSSSRFVTKRT
ncbi:hypothetical protein BpHYR1_014455 [Brachionus plicatilis]|uniref:Uncharacterized protein n=1 Tax=Brachionus plicatilis TaxID=10195 RepID=A0A3M7PU43_BRAPC|nr:hypothetical protein BpHYR1_014455 [Brachionus plicatilis]